MKSGVEIVQFVDEYTAAMLDRPHMYAGTPESLEEILYTLDVLRTYAVSAEAQPIRGSWYGDYCSELGYGALGYFGRRKLEGKPPPNFAEVAQFFRDFLRWKADR
jgi:hypothetical protein